MWRCIPELRRGGRRSAGFGATPSKFPSVEAIVKRARRGDALPYVNDLVAVGTYVTSETPAPHWWARLGPSRR